MKLSQILYLAGAALFAAAVFRDIAEDKRELENKVWQSAVDGKPSQPVTNG